MFLIVILADQSDVMIPIRLNPKHPFFGIAPVTVVESPQFLHRYDGMMCFVIVIGEGFGISAIILVCWVVWIMFLLPHFEHFSTV